MEIKNMLFILALAISFVFGYSLFKTVDFFLKISVKRQNKEYKNFFYEWINLNPNLWYKGFYIDFFPISYLLHKIDNKGYKESSEEIKLLYDQKYKFEKIVWLLFALGLLAIPIIEYVITPYLK